MHKGITEAEGAVFIGIIGNAGAGAPHEPEGAASFREGVIISKERSRAVDADGPFLTDRFLPADHERRAQSPGVAVPVLPVFREISVGPGEGEAAPERNGAVPLHFLIKMDRVIVDVAVVIKTVLYVFKLDLHGMGTRSRRFRRRSRRDIFSGCGGRKCGRFFPVRLRGDKNGRGAVGAPDDAGLFRNRRRLPFRGERGRNGCIKILWIVIKEIFNTRRARQYFQNENPACRSMGRQRGHKYL